MKEQLYVVLVDMNLMHRAQYLREIEHNVKHPGSVRPERVESLQAQVSQCETQGPNLSAHTGGKGNGAVGSLYTKGQLNRILGRYPKGFAKAVPVAYGFTQSEADENEKQAEWMSCYEQAGVDNWPGRDEAISIYHEQYGEDDDE